jgi:hypothetical protein
MHKFPIPIAYEDPRAQSRSRLLRHGAIVVLGLGLAPLIFEGGSICYAQWCQVMGRNAQASTPVLDVVQNQVESGHRTFWDAISPCFQRLPWNPRPVLLVGVIFTIVGMMMLKL